MKKIYLLGELYVFYDTPSLRTLQLRVRKFESTPGKKVFLRKLNLFIFSHSLLSGRSFLSNAVVVCRPLSSFPLVVQPPRSPPPDLACHCCLLPSSSAGVVICHCRCRHLPPLLSTAAIFRCRSHHCHPVSPPSLAARSRSCPS
jgi:hypothetical protein